MGKRPILLTYLFLFFMLCQFGYAQEIENLVNEKPFEFSGSFTLFTSSYHVSGIDPRRKDFSWYITGNPNLKVYGIDIPFTITVSEQERSFRQPFNQFSISPSYKWAKLHLGYSNLTWSPFTWAGQTSLGAGIEINPNKFRFGFLHGRLNRAVEEDLNTLELQTPAFKRTGLATRIGFGTQTSYFDLIFLKGKDDENSLFTIPTKTEVLPAENAVLGLSSKVKFTEKIFWNIDLATSVYTRDINATPFTEGNGSFGEKFASLIHVNTSTQSYNAVQSELSFVTKKFKIKAKYKRVEPDFKSMGAYYFQTDIENITLEPSFILTKAKLKINSSIGKQKDNLMSKKTFTTTRLIGNIGLDWSPFKVFGINALYANYSGDQSKGLKIPNQTTQQSYVSQNILISPRLTFIKEKLTHFHILVANRQWLQDNNLNTAIQTEYQVDNLNYTSSFVLNKVGLTLNASYLLSVFNSNSNTNRLNGFSLVGSKAFLDHKLLSNVTFSNTFQELNSIPLTTILTISSQHSYKITTHHGINFLVNYLNNQSKVATTNSFLEYNLDLGYTYTF